MESLDYTLTQLFQVREYDQKLEQRAEQHECLRGRNNVTSCRSPTRELDTKLIKKELRRKRQLEFQRRRPVSLKSASSGSEKDSQERTFAIICQTIKSEGLQAIVSMTPISNGRPLVMTTSKRITSDDLSTSARASLWTEQKNEKKCTRKQEAVPFISRPVREQLRVKATTKTERGLNTGTGQLHRIEKTVQEVSVQTEPGFVTVKESDVLQLADYLQEALGREEALKKKLAVLQKSAAILLHSSDQLWTNRCNEDLLRNKVKALEVQLQVCLQQFSRDGVKKLVLQMEKEKGTYEEKALRAIQRATQEKTEALSKTETLQEALRAAKAEVSWWQGLCEELKQSSGQLKRSQELSSDQLQQLQSQLELAKGREAELREELGSLQKVGVELCSNMAQLVENNQALRKEIQNMRDASSEAQESRVQLSVSPEEEEQLSRGDTQVVDQLRHTQDRLRLKERECEELQTELEAVELECQSCQARLSQCRDELRQLSHRRSSKRSCGSWLGVFVLLFLVLAVVALAVLWLWHPPFRDQVLDLYSDLEHLVQDYLLEVASPQHSGCFRPV